MQHRRGKIKTEHHILSEFHSFLETLAKHDDIKRIIPGRISRKKSGSSKRHISISYNTSSGIKILMKKGSTAQECFITCNKKNTVQIVEYISTFI